MKHEKVVKELVQKLKEKFGGRIESVIVFGSYARGEWREKSDIDVLIIGDVKLDEIMDITYPILLEHGVYISPIVMSRDYFEMLKAEKTGFIENVLKEGTALYGGIREVSRKGSRIP
ncbi:MAG: nucleotidyltransferase domain-containing protein [Candidatus Alkanophagales archaeon]|nr:MAG: nucleotidyltransferase domain-containing protein [Candidatus Alkanophagales archaeon]